MHPKERVRTALNHQEPDRVPMMMSANTWVVKELKKHFQVKTDKALLKAMKLDIFDLRGIDIKGAIGPKFIGPEGLGIGPDWCGDLLPIFNYHEVVTKTEFGKSYSMGVPPLGQYETIGELSEFQWPSVDWFDFSNLRSEINPISEEFAIAFTGPSVFQHATLFRGLSRMMMDMAADPELANYILDHVTQFYYEYTAQFLEEVGDLIDIIRLADDIGAENGLLISPMMIENFLKERIKMFSDLAHKYDAKLLFHTDGNVRKIIPSLIDWGVDILDPVQPDVEAMSHVELKEEFGHRLCFSGGVSTKRVLPHQNVEGVKKEVIRVINQLGKNGGYILSPGHPNLQGDVPIKNIVAMYEVGVEYGAY